MSLKDQTGTGLIDDFTFYIKDARFFHDARFQDGEVAILELVGINNVTGDEDRIWLKCGKTWQASNNGATITYTGSSRNPKINKNTQYGIWIDSFVQCDGTDELVDKMDAFVAKSWIGLTVDVHRSTRTYNIEGNTYEGQVLEVTRVHPTGTTIDDTAKGEWMPEVPDAIREKLNEIAESSATFEEYVDTAYEKIPEMLDASWEAWATSPDGPWSSGM